MALVARLRRREHGAMSTMSDATHTTTSVTDDASWRTIRFEVPATTAGRHVDLVAEFLAWTPFALDRRPDGSFSAAIRLRRGHTWGYHFLLDGQIPITDAAAPGTSRLPDGTAVSLLRT